MRALTVCLAALVVVGCAGKVDYVRPTSWMQPGQNVKVVDKPRDTVWNAAVPELGKRFFVINNLDKSSGLINVSYSGDPERYVDCGRVTSFVKNARGERTYDFAGAKAQQTYEIMNPQGLFFIDRMMTLDGRVNLIFEEVSPTQTRVTASTKYVVSRDLNVRNVEGRTASLKSSVSFNTSGGAAFPAGADGRGTECVPTGALERELLSVIN
jgi:hypothetical protein